MIWGSNTILEPPAHYLLYCYWVGQICSLPPTHTRFFTGSQTALAAYFWNLHKCTVPRRHRPAETHLKLEMGISMMICIAQGRRKQIMISTAYLAVKTSVQRNSWLHFSSMTYIFFYFMISHQRGLGQRHWLLAMSFFVHTLCFRSEGSQKERPQRLWTWFYFLWVCSEYLAA